MTKGSFAWLERPDERSSKCFWIEARIIAFNGSNVEADNETEAEESSTGEAALVDKALKKKR